jgi:hypothetical protein
MGRKPQWVEDANQKLRDAIKAKFADAPTQNVKFDGTNGHEYTRYMNEPGRPTTNPVSYPPGSAEKIAELRARVGRCEDLWHQDDCDNLASVSAIVRNSAHDRPRHDPQTLSKAETFLYHDPMIHGEQEMPDDAL